MTLAISTLQMALWERGRSLQLNYVTPYVRTMTLFMHGMSRLVDYVTPYVHTMTLWAHLRSL